MASVPSINSSYDNLLTQTINRWMAANYADAFTGHHPFWMRLMQKGNIVRGGQGYAWNEPFVYPTAVGPVVVGISDGYQELAEATETGGMTMASFTPAQFGMLVAVEEYDLDAQGSETEKINHVQAMMDVSNKKYFERFAAQLWAAEGARGTDGTARDVLGSIRTYLNGGGVAPGASVEPQPKTAQLTAAVGTSPLTSVGGVNRAVAGGAYFCPNLYNPTNPATCSLNLFNQLYTTATRGTDKPDLVIVDETLYNFLMTTLQSQQRWVGNGSLAEVGFESFKWRGADVIFDDGVPTATNARQCFMVNTDHFKLRYNTMKPFFILSPEPRKPIKQWRSGQTLQITSDDLGRLHSRHAKISDP